jgi:hypothetical protein
MALVGSDPAGERAGPGEDQAEDDAEVVAGVGEQGGESARQP